MMFILILTIYLVSKQFSIDHPVGVEEHAPEEEPRGLLILEVDGLPHNTKADQHDKYYYHKVGHIS